MLSLKWLCFCASFHNFSTSQHSFNSFVYETRFRYKILMFSIFLRLRNIRYCFNTIVLIAVWRVLIARSELARNLWYLIIGLMNRFVKFFRLTSTIHKQWKKCYQTDKLWRQIHIDNFSSMFQKFTSTLSQLRLKFLLVYMLYMLSLLLMFQTWNKGCKETRKRM